MSQDVLDRPEVTVARWVATVFYRTEAGLVDVQHDISELDEMQDLVERGPHWDAIDHINIVRADGADLSLTVEEAARI
jgi:hypothetical protein